MSLTSTCARLGALALAASALTVGLSPSTGHARAGAPADVSPRRLTGAVDNDAFDAQYATLGKRVVFAGFDNKDGYGSEPWITDGTPTGTHRIKAIIANTHSHLTNLTTVGSQVYFTVVDDKPGATAWQLWVTNGKASGTHLVHSWAISGNNLIPNHLTAVGKNLFFNASSSTGRQLWVSNGKKAGTKVLMKFPDDGLNFEDVSWAMTSLGGKLYFPAQDSTHGIELWSSDGTKAGTSMAVDVVSGATGSDPTELRTYRGDLFFEGNGHIYASDGSSGGTTQLMSGGNPINGSVTAGQPLGTTMLFYANVNGTNGWAVTDGTQGGTSFEALPSAPAQLQIEAGFAGIGSQVLFSARQIGPNDDEELWSTDGTTAGTHLVEDIYPGLLPSSPTNFTSIGKRAVFDAQIPNKGDQLFVSDGTAGGTHRLGYRVEDSATLNPTYRAGMVFFDGPDSVYYQPWVWEPGPKYLSWCTLTVAKKFGHGSRPKATAKVGSSASLKGASVALFDGRKKLGSHKLKKGKAAFKLPGNLKVGKHPLQVAFAGHGDVGSCSASRKVTVTR